MAVEERIPESGAPPPAEDALLDRFLRGGTVVAVAAAVLLTVAHFGNEVVLDSRIGEFNANAEGNTLTWASTVATFAAAFAALLHAVLLPGDRGRFAAIAAIAAFFSLDDLVRIHERLERAAREDLGLSADAADQTEVVLYLPLFAAAFLLMWMLSRQVAPRAGRTLRLGLVVLVCSVVAEGLGTATRRISGADWIDDLRKGSEEALELGGWILVAVALTAIVCAGLIALGRRPAASAPG